MTGFAGYIKVVAAVFIGVITGGLGLWGMEDFLKSQPFILDLWWLWILVLIGAGMFVFKIKPEVLA